jgi:hypothetical protein
MKPASVPPVFREPHWTALGGLFERYPNMPDHLLREFALLDMQMTWRTSVGITAGYLDSGVTPPLFRQMHDILNELPGDCEWTFVYVGPLSDHCTTVFEYRILPGTLAAEKAVIGGVFTARQAAAKGGKEAMKEHLALLKKINDVPTLKEVQRARGGHGTGCACCGCGARV